MNWFERYGIPGAYFVGLMAFWVRTSYPDLLKNWVGLDPQWLLALAAITFLPIGYVISILGQVVYLNWRRWLTRLRLHCLVGWLGFHGAALDVFRVSRSDKRDERTLDEAINEARTLLLTASTNDPLGVHTHRYIRDWIARRMDVVAISASIIWASVLAIIFAIIFLALLGVPHHLLFGLSGVITLLIVVVLVGIVMVCSIIVLRRQIIEVITGIYRRCGTTF